MERDWRISTSILAGTAAGSEPPYSCRRARALSPLRLELYTFARNEGARRFYEHHGFRAIAFGQENEEDEPDVLYEWKAGSAG